MTMIEPAAPYKLAVEDRERYNDIKYLPNINNKLVNIAPPRISLNFTLASGRNEKIKPNSVTMTTKVIPVLTQSINVMGIKGKYCITKFVTAAITPLIIREAINKNPNAMMMENEIRRLMINFSHPFLGLGFTFHI